MLLGRNVQNKNHQYSRAHGSEQTISIPPVIIMTTLWTIYKSRGKQI